MSNTKSRCNYEGSSDCENKQKKEKNCFGLFSSLPKGVFAVSLFGLFLGASTTMIYSQLGMFLKHELHASTLKIAMIDGIVEFLSFLTRIFSGLVSDYLRNRKFILLIGCTITLFMKPLFAISKSAITVLIAQAVERIGNGLQACPRDALIADLSTKDTHGQSFGFSRSLKTLGALAGTAFAVVAMYMTDNNYRLLFFCAAIPVVISIICLCKIKTKSDATIVTEHSKMENPFKRKYLKSLDMDFWKIIILASLFELGHFSEHLLPLRANDFVDKTFAGAVSMAISIGQILCSYPIGLYADKLGKKYFIPLCMLMMVLANLSLLYANSIYMVYIGAFLWGGQMTAVQGVFLSIISEKVNEHLRGTVIGIYYVTIGLSYMIASAVAGDLWDSYGCHMAFTYSIVCSVIAACAFLFLYPKTMEKA